MLFTATITLTFIAGAACLAAYHRWFKVSSRFDGSDGADATRPSVGMHGALVEPRR